MYIETIKRTLNILNQYGTAIMAIGTTAYFIITWFILSENRKAYNAQYVPIISLEYNEKTKEFVCENIGPGLAIDIEIGSYNLFVEDRGLDYKLIFNKVNNLKSREKRPVLYRGMLNGKSNDPWIQTAQLSKYGGTDKIFSLTVKDILGNTYCEKINMGKSGVFIIKHFKVNWVVRFYVGVVDKCDEYIKYVYARYKRTLNKARKAKAPSPSERG